MNKISFNLVSFLLGIAALTVASNPMSVRAEAPSAELASTSIQTVEPAIKSAATTNSTASAQRVESASVPVQSAAPGVIPASAIDQLGNLPTATTMPEPGIVQRPVQQANSSDTNPYQADTQNQQPKAVSNDSQSLLPATKDVTGVPAMPEKLATSANYLTAKPSTTSMPVLSSHQTDTKVAQENINIQPGRATRGGSSYIGIGGNIGLSGNPALGDGAFVINSKIGLTRNVSFRPAVLFGNDTDFLLPLTYDFVIESADPFAPIPFAPYLGGGVIVSTNGDNDIGFLLTGGVDVPLSAQFVANASINVGFRNDTDVGIILGVGYTFPGFSR